MQILRFVLVSLAMAVGLAHAQTEPLRFEPDTKVLVIGNTFAERVAL